MDTLLDLIDEHVRRRRHLLVMACSCSCPAATLAFGVMAVVRVRGAVKRRAAGIGRATS